MARPWGYGSLLPVPCLTQEPGLPSAGMAALASLPDQAGLQLPLAYYGRWRLLLLCTGLSVRLCCAPCPGFEQDYIYFRDWVHYMHVYGFAGVYRVDPVTEQVLNYPPVYLYVLKALDGFYRRALPQVAAGGNWHQALFRIPPIAADLLLAWLMMIIVRRRYGDRPSLVAGLALTLNPAIWYTSSYWGQVDSVFCLPLVLSLWMASQRRAELAGGWLAVAVLTKTQGIIYGPLVVLAVMRRRSLVDLVRFSVVFLLVSLVILAPFLFAGTAGLMARKAFAENYGFFPYLSLNAANLWGLHPNPETFDWHAPALLFDGQMKVDADDLLVRWFSFKRIALFLLAVAYIAILVCFWWRPVPDDVFRAGGAIATAFFLLAPEMHERYLFPALVLLAVPMPWHPGLRVVYGGMSLIYLLNLAIALPPRTLFYVLSLFQVLLGGLAAWFVLARTGQRWEPKVWIGRRRNFAIAAFVALLLPVVLWAPRIRPDHTFRYLSDLEPIDYVQAWGPLVRDANLNKQPIRLGAYRFRKGLGTHADATLVYAVPPYTDAFESWMGLDQSIRDNPEACTRASVSFSLEVDGVFVFRSEVLSATSPPLFVRVPVRDRQQMILRVHDAGDGNTHDHACFGGARFVRDPAWPAAVEIQRPDNRAVIP